MLKLARFATLLTALLLPFPAQADDGAVLLPPEGDSLVRVAPYLDQLPWQQIAIRGDAAAALYEQMRDVPEYQVMRADGTYFWVRHAEKLGCARSDLYAEPHYACIAFLKPDGTMAPGTLDPEYGQAARIGVSN